MDLTLHYFYCHVTILDLYSNPHIQKEKEGWIYSLETKLLA